MTPLWNEVEEAELPAISLIGWVLVIVRGTLLIALIAICLLLLILTRFIERPIWGLHRPITPHITQFVCRMAFVVLGMRFVLHGTQMTQKGAVVANHSSWLDIFTLNARKRIYFVSKSEVANWPGIGLLAKATGTVFIRREKRDALAQKTVFEDRLQAGHKLLFFPEGTSTDGLRVLPFKSTLFAAFFTPKLLDILSIQPVTVVYHAPKNAAIRHYGWWGDMEFGPHLLHTLGTVRQGWVEVTYHPPVKVNDFSDRKALAKYCEDQVRSALPKTEEA